MKRPQGELSNGLFFKILYELLAHKTPVRLIRFGEPTLHPYWDTIIKLMEDNGIPVHMNTNGIKMDPDKVLESGLTSIKISVHSQGGFNAARDMIEARKYEEKPYITVAYLSKDFDFGDLPGADHITRSPTKDLTKPRLEYVQCPEVYDKLSIDWDGKVTACCSDWNRWMMLGDLNEKGVTLQSIWQHSVDLKRYRNMLANGRGQELPLCMRCPRAEGGDI